MNADIFAESQGGGFIWLTDWEGESAHMVRSEAIDYMKEVFDNGIFLCTIVSLRNGEKVRALARIWQIEEAMKIRRPAA